MRLPTIVCALSVLTACFEPSVTVIPSLTPSTNNTIAVCSAGMSEKLSGRLSAIVKGGEASVTSSVEAEIKGAIFDDKGIVSSDKVLIFDRYLSCVQRIRAENELPKNALDVVQKDTNPVVWKKARGSRGNSLSEINWTGGFKISYFNSSDVAVSCTATIRGENQDKFSRETLGVGQTKTQDFQISPGSTYVFEGEIGAPGYTDSGRTVTLRDFLNCRYS
jgi:hypothetical protein